MPNSHSFTLTSAGGAFLTLITDCRVSQAFGSTNAGCDPVLFQAIWDTGATASVISQQIIEACDLKPIGMTKVHGVHGIQESEIYLVNIFLPNKVMFPEVRVTKGSFPAGSGDMLIGMDIIAGGDFSFTNLNGNSMFSFRYPSAHHIDYVAQDKVNSLKPQPHGGSKSGRRKSPKRHGKNK